MSEEQSKQPLRNFISSNDTSLRSPAINDHDSILRIAAAMVAPLNKLVAEKGIRSRALPVKLKDGFPSSLDKTPGTDLWSVEIDSEGEINVVTHMQDKPKVHVCEIEIVSRVEIEDKTADAVLNELAEQLCSEEHRYEQALCEEATKQGVEKIMLIVCVRREIDVIPVRNADSNNAIGFVAFELVSIAATPHKDEPEFDEKADAIEKKQDN